MYGRGGGVSGRGAILRMLQESSDETSSNNDTQIGQSTCDSGIGSGRSVGLSAGRGRLLLETTDDCDNSAKVVSSSRSGSSFISEETSGDATSFQQKPMSGRGSILQFLKEEAAISRQNLPVTPIVEKADDSVREHLEEMKIETDKEPVIRRGTKGLFKVFVYSAL